MSSPIHVIWKRPDGFHGALPSDFDVVEVNGHSRLWLHKKDKDMYPFRISGGWEEDLSSRRLNRLVNLINKSDRDWLEELSRDYDRSNKNDPKKYLLDLSGWIDEVANHLKGDKWEIEIMAEAIGHIKQKITALGQGFESENPA